MLLLGLGGLGWDFQRRSCPRGKWSAIGWAVQHSWQADSQGKYQSTETKTLNVNIFIAEWDRDAQAEVLSQKQQTLSCIWWWIGRNAPDGTNLPKTLAYLLCIYPWGTRYSQKLSVRVLAVACDSRKATPQLALDLTLASCPNSQFPSL